MRRMVLLPVVASIALLTAPATAQTNDQVAKEIIAITKAQWAAEIARKPSATSMQSVAGEYTEFNADAPTRVDGKEVNMRLLDAFYAGANELVAAEMTNEKVQVYGDVAILTYNFVGMTKNKDGVVEPSLAKSTRVYVKKGSSWMLVHANFAPVN